MKFYAISLDICTPADFAEEARVASERSAEDAAIEMVEFEDLQDNVKGKAMVADNPEGKGAKVYIVTQRVRVTYEATKEQA